MPLWTTKRPGQRRALRRRSIPFHGRRSYGVALATNHPPTLRFKTQSLFPKSTLQVIRQEQVERRRWSYQARYLTHLGIKHQTSRSLSALGPILQQKWRDPASNFLQGLRLKAGLDQRATRCRTRQTQQNTESKVIVGVRVRVGPDSRAASPKGRTAYSTLEVILVFL